MQYGVILELKKRIKNKMSLFQIDDDIDRYRIKLLKEVLTMIDDIMEGEERRQIEAGDKVVVFALPADVHEVEKLFN